MTALRFVVHGILLVTFFFLGISSVQAQAAQNTITVKEANYSPQSPQYINLMFINLIHTISCFAEGQSIIGQSCITGVATDKKTNKLQVYESSTDASGGSLGTIVNIITLSYASKPLKTSEYITDLSNNLGFIKPAHAQVSGSGNSVIEPIKRIWQLSRNIAYLGITVIFLVIGFMIMFRHRLNPQTVINIQSALPGLVIGLILITFSYFFSALLVDLAFVSTNVVGSIFAAAGFGNSEIITQTVKEGNIINTLSKVVALDTDQAFEVAQETGATLAFLKEGFIGRVVRILADLLGCKFGASTLGGLFPGALNVLGPVTGAVFGTFGNPLGQITGCVIGAVGGQILVESGLLEWLAGLVLYLILILALLIAMFRIMFSIINAYVGIILLTLTAPIRFLMASLPGSKGGFGPWLREMLSNVLIFPAYFTIFFIAAFILGNSVAEAFGIDPSTAPTDQMFQSGAVPFLGGLSTLFLRIILGYGLLLFAPNIPDIIKGTLGVKDPGYGKMVIGAALGGYGLGKGFLSRTFAPVIQERKARQEAKLKNLVSPPAQPGREPTRPYQEVGTLS